MLDINDWPRQVPEPPEPPPVLGVIADLGLGKTSTWIDTVAAPLVALGLHPILAVPRHQLGDEIVENLEKAGIRGFVYRGREADDPLAPGEKMCREQERIAAIGYAIDSVSTRACKNGDKKCQFFDVCGYQRQQRERPEVSIIAHEWLFHQRPDFIRPPDAVAIDERFHDAGLRGLEKLKPIRLWLRLLKDDRTVPGSVFDTADLTAISDRVHAALSRETGRIRRAALVTAEMSVADLRLAARLEWKRKLPIKEVVPGMPLDDVLEICGAVAAHNQDVKALIDFWNLAARTLAGDFERSPWLELRTNEPVPPFGTHTEPAIRMAWRQDINADWSAPTVHMDATMQPDIVRQYLPRMAEPLRFTAPAPHVYVRQIIDRPMSAHMLHVQAGAREKDNQTAENNTMRVWEFIEMRANGVSPGRVLAICQKQLEGQLKQLPPLPDTIEIRHFNAIAGEDKFKDVALLIVIGRTIPGPQDVEREARALFGADIAETRLGQWYPAVRRAIQMRDGRVAVIDAEAHPDPRAEAIRRSICEAELLQAIGRARAVNRTADNPLKIDILTNVPLPIVVDELTTWELLKPSYTDIMRSRGAVPLRYRDMADAYPDLFVSRDSAKMALRRENPEQTPIDELYIGVCSGFLAIDYRRGARGLLSELLFDPKHVADPAAWLAERLGVVTMKGKARKPDLQARRRRRLADLSISPRRLQQLLDARGVADDSAAAVPVSAEARRQAARRSIARYAVDG